MTTKELIITIVKSETKAFINVMNALPQDKLDYKNPDDPKGKSAGSIFASMAGSSSTFASLVQNSKVDFDSVDWAGMNDFAKAKEVFAKSINELPSLIESTSDEAWNGRAQMFMGGRMAWEAPVAEMLLGLINDLIHHRGQLSTYIRPMGGQVPSIYGPSGDFEN